MRRGRPPAPFVPGAGAEQLQQAAAVRASFVGLAADAVRNRLAKDPRARHFTGDVANPMRQLITADTALADAVSSAAQLPHLPGNLPRGG